MRGIAADLGVERGTLRHWLYQYGTRKKTDADGTVTRSPLEPGGRRSPRRREWATRRPSRRHREPSPREPVGPQAMHV